MARLGMDIDLVEAYARRLETQAVNEVAAVMTGMNGIVQEVMQVWYGPDAQSFGQAWDQQRQSLTLLHGALGDLVGVIDRAVLDQRMASSD